MTQALKLPGLLGKGCVLQRGEAAGIWGWCRPCEEVWVTLAQREQSTRADEDGGFFVRIPEPEPGGPYALKVKTASGEQIDNRDVYVGEVFVCAGQSNMELPMRRVRERFPEEFFNGGAPFVHLYKVWERYEFEAPLKDHEQAAWTVCTPDNLEEISALSYFVGKQLQEKLKIPVGILNLSLGGTPVEAWMSREGLEGLPDYLMLADRCRDVNFLRELTARKAEEENAWYARIEREEKRGTAGGFGTITLPGYLKDAGLEQFCGSIWLRRAFRVPADCAGKRGYLQLGTMTDSDRTCVNGCLVGETGYCYPPRRYVIPEGLLREGTNEISIRLICRNGGGRVTPGKHLRILWEDPCRLRPDFGSEKKEGPSEKPAEIAAVELAGQWEYRVGAVTGAAPEQIFINRKPTGLFQGMVAPCLPFEVKGVVWYQGESNDTNPDDYEELLCRMILDWRKQWKQEKLPFIIVQLPNCGIDIAPEDAWPRIREAQRRAGKLPDTAVTVNLDLGEDNDLHPLDKKTVAKRIVRAVRGLIYQEKIPFSGPEVKTWSVQHSEVCLTCETGDQKGLVQRCVTDPACEFPVNTGRESTPLFEMAGPDGIFHPAKAAVSGRRIRLWADAVTDPRLVRYAFRSAPSGPLLYNQSGLPASPFLLKL